MRKAVWSSAALFVLLSSVLAWQARAATTTVTTGSDDKPFKFFPAEVTIKVGDTVSWENNTDIPHDVTAADGSFKSEILNRDDKFTLTFTNPGEFKYICAQPGHEDAGMVGVVKVGGGAAAPPASSSTTTTATTAPDALGRHAPSRTSAAAASPTTTTSEAQAGESTTTTTAGAVDVTSTTQAPAVTPTSAPESGATTSTTTAAGSSTDGHADDEEASSEEKDDPENSPLGIAFAGISTLIVAAISGKLLFTKH